MSDFNEINHIAMNPTSDEYMDIDRYNSLARASHPEYGDLEAKVKPKAVKEGTKISSLLIKADLIATIVLVTAVAGPSIVADYLNDALSPITCEFVETIAETNEIDYYLSIDSLEKTLGDVEIRVTNNSDFYETYPVKEGKNIQEITGLKENMTYTVSLYDGGCLVKKTEIKTLTEKEKIERGWRKFFENFFDIYYDKESDILSIKMKIVDDLDRYEMIMIYINDDMEGYLNLEINPEEKNLRQEIPLREQDIKGNKIYLSIMGFLKYQEEQDIDVPHEDFLYEGEFIIDEDENGNDNEPVEVSDVVSELIEYISDTNEISYAISVGNASSSSNNVTLVAETDNGDEVVNLYDGKNIGTIYGLSPDRIYLFSVYDGDILITTYQLNTISEESRANRELSEFYLNFTTFNYLSSYEELEIIMKVIDDVNRWSSYRICVKGADNETEVSFDAEEINYSHIIDLGGAKITDDVIEISFFATTEAGGEELLSTIDYYIEEGVYEPKQ